MQPAHEFLIIAAPNYFVLVLMLLIPLFFMLGVAVLAITALKNVTPGTALIRTGMGGTKVGFDRLIAIPILHQVSSVDITSQHLKVSRQSDNNNGPLRFKDGSRAELQTDFVVRIDDSAEDVIRAVKTLGIERVNNEEALRDHFNSIFNDTLDTIAGKFSFDEFTQSRAEFREELITHIGSGLQGMTLQDIAIHQFNRID